MKIKAGTVMLAVPTTGPDRAHCFVCTGPAGDRDGAFVVGMAAGITALQGGLRPQLCVEHETLFRQALSGMGATNGAVLRKLGIEYRVATGKEE